MKILRQLFYVCSATQIVLIKIQLRQGEQGGMEIGTGGVVIDLQPKGNLKQNTKPQIQTKDNLSDNSPYLQQLVRS